MTTFTLFFVVLLAISTVCVQGYRRGGHHHNDHDHDHDPDLEHPRRPPPLPPPPDDPHDSDKEPELSSGSSTFYIMGIALACLAVVFMSVGLGLYVLKKKKFVNKVGLDSTRTPVVSVIKYPPPRYESKMAFHDPLPPVERTAPPSEPPAYAFLPPRTPPPPYELMDKQFR